jgi:DNA invertase Pin-like site-specific DNA recombinase
MRKPKPTKIVGYLRTSTDDQLLGIDAQDSRLRKLAEEYHCGIAKVFTEHESGANVNRVELDRAIRHARRLRAYLVVAKLDRLSRDQQFLMKLVDGNVPIIFGDMPGLDCTTSEGRLHLQVLSSFAEFERNRIRDRTREALRILKQNGVKLGKPENLTHQARLKGVAVSARRRRQEAIDDQSDIAEIASRMRREGASLGQIAAHLNSEGFPTRHGSEGTGQPGQGGWRPIQVKRILDRLQPGGG